MPTPGIVQDQSSSNPLCTLLDSPPEDFTRTGLLRTIAAREIERITFRYVGGDGELRELRLPATDLGRADRILALGERIDGSSVFDGLIGAEDSDLYAVPMYRSAFLDPFDPRSLDLMCRLLDRDGRRCVFAPDSQVERATDVLAERSGLQLEALAELEFFLLGSPADSPSASWQRGGYHATAPQARYGDVVGEMAMHLSRITGAVKYAHSEAGFIESLRSGHPVLAGRRAEQHEIELLARPAAQMADIVALARWVIRGVACRHGLLVTFAPKIDAGVPGNGLHVHVELLHGEDSAMSDAQGGLSSTAHRLIGGLMKHASSLCAFGNTAATSYLRLVPGLEAPTQAEWSDSDRSALVRVPLACRGDNLMVRAVNPTEPMELVDTGCRQTVEWRLADGSAHPHRLLAGIATAATWGLTRAESLELARATKASPRTSPSADGGAALEPLPPSCGAAAQSLLRARRMYEADGVFPPAVIDLVVEQLRRRQAASLCSDGHPAGRHGLGQERSAMDNDMMAL